MIAICRAGDNPKLIAASDVSGSFQRDAYGDNFLRLPATSQIFQTDQLHSLGWEVWSVGQWWMTLQSPGGPVFLSGYWLAIIVDEGDIWKFRMLMFSEASRLTPPPGAAAE